MEHRIEALVREHVRDQLAVCDVTLDERRRRRDSLPDAGREVVQHRHGEAVGEKTISEVRSDEAGAAGDENASHEVGRTSSPRISSSVTVTFQLG